MILHKNFQGHVAHGGCHKQIARQFAPGHHGLGAHGHKLVAVNDVAVFVHNNEAVSIAVQRKAHVGPHLAHLGRHHFGIERAAVLVDVGAVRACADAENFGSQFFKSQRGNFVAGAVGAVNHNAQARKRQLGRETAFGVNNIAPPGVFNLGGAANAARFRIGPFIVRIQHHGRYFVFGQVGELVTIGIKKFDAVVVKGVVRGGNNHPKVGPHAAGKEGYGRSGQRAGHDHVHAGGAQAGSERRFKHVA